MSAAGLMGTTRPGNPAEQRLASTLPPTFEGSREAPTTATHCGSKKGASEGKGDIVRARGQLLLIPNAGLLRRGVMSSRSSVAKDPRPLNHNSAERLHRRQSIEP